MEEFWFFVLAFLWSCYEAVALFWRPVGHLMGAFRLAFSASACLELPGEPLYLAWFSILFIQLMYPLCEISGITGAVWFLLCILFVSFPSLLSFFSFASSGLLAGYLEHASAAKRDKAAVVPFFFSLMDGWMDVWMDGWMDGWGWMAE